MSGFLWTTTAGMVDFIILAMVAGLRLVWGPSDARWIAGVLLAAFLANRTALALVSEPAFGLCVTGIAFGAMAWTRAVSDSRAAKAVSVLWAMQTAIFVGLAMNAITFETMAACVTVAAYLQLVILAFTGPVNGMALHLGWIGTVCRRARDALALGRKAV